MSEGVSNETSETYETVQSFGEAPNYRTSDTSQLNYGDITGNPNLASQPVIPGSIIAFPAFSFIPYYGASGKNSSVPDNSVILGYGPNTVARASSAYYDSIALGTVQIQNFQEGETRDVNELNKLLLAQTKQPLNTPPISTNQFSNPILTTYYASVEPKSAGTFFGAVADSYGFGPQNYSVDITTYTETPGVSPIVDNFEKFF